MNGRFAISSGKTTITFFKYPNAEMPRAGSHRLPPVGKESLRAAIRKAAKIFEDFSFLVKGKNCRVGRFGTCSRTSGRELHAVWLESLLCAVRRRFLFLATAATVTWRGRPTQTARQVVTGVTWRVDAPHSQPATTPPGHASSFPSAVAVAKISRRPTEPA